MTPLHTRNAGWSRTHLAGLLAVALLFCLFPAGSLPLQAKEAKLPSAEKILDGFVKATGSKAIRNKLNNRRTVALLDLAAQGITLRMTIHSARPNLNYTVIESEITGKIEKGTDGETVWEVSDMMGPQIKEGQERIDFLREANFDRFGAWRELYDDAKCTGVETVEDRAAYKVVLTPRGGTPQTMYFDTESRLLVKHEMVIENPMGTIPMESLVGDYREVDGVLLPFTVRVLVMGQERLITTESVEHDVEFPADRFELPQAIRELVEGSASPSGTKG